MAMLTTFAHARLNGHAVPGATPQALYTGPVHLKAEAPATRPDLLAIHLFDSEGGVHAMLSLHPDECAILANGFTRFAGNQPQRIDAAAALKTLESLCAVIRRREPDTPPARRASDNEYNTALLCAEFLVEQARTTPEGRA